MTPKQIKIECEQQHKAIKDAQDRLEELREICTHKTTHEGNLSWRVGVIQLAIICSDCGKLIEYKDEIFE